MSRLVLFPIDGGSTGFLFAYALDARARVYIVVYGPVGTFTSICEWSGDLLERAVEGEVVANRVL